MSYVIELIYGDYQRERGLGGVDHGNPGGGGINGDGGRLWVVNTQYNIDDVL